MVHTSGLTRCGFVDQLTVHTSELTSLIAMNRLNGCVQLMIDTCELSVLRTCGASTANIYTTYLRARDRLLSVYLFYIISI